MGSYMQYLSLLVLVPSRSTATTTTRLTARTGIVIDHLEKVEGAILRELSKFHVVVASIVLSAAHLDHGRWTLPSAILLLLLLLLLLTLLLRRGHLLVLVDSILDHVVALLLMRTDGHRRTDNASCRIATTSSSSDVHHHRAAATVAAAAEPQIGPGAPGTAARHTSTVGKLQIRVVAHHLRRRRPPPGRARTPPTGAGTGTGVLVDHARHCVAVVRRW